MENKNLTLLVLLDFSSAFNSVDFDVLLGILSSLNCTASSISWFNSYLRGRTQCVRLDESHSDWCSLTAGVPQGGVLSPLLFSIFINSVTRVISSNYHLYADDLQLYRSFASDDVNSAVAAMNYDLGLINEWAKSHGLLLNPAKTQVMIIGSVLMRSRLDFTTIPPILVDGNKVEYKVTAKNLGIIFDCNLSWKAQVSEISKKIHFAIHSLKRLQNFLPLKTKISLVQTLIQPIFDYADSSYLDATEELLNKLERLQNLGIRFIFGLKKYDHISSFRKDLKWLPIRLRRNTRLLCLLFKILFIPSSPPYLQERFTFSHSSDSLCRSHLKLQLNFPSHTTDFYSFSFTVHAVRLWNSLPSSIRSSNTITLFKDRVKNYYLSTLS